MARWATKAIIGAVDFTGCRVEVINGSGFMSDFVGSADWANDNTIHIQVVDRGKKGIPFTLQFVSMSQEDMEELLTAVQAAQSAAGTVVVDVEDGIYDIEVNATPDYTKDPWITHGKHSEGWYENVALHFISRSEVI